MWIESFGFSLFRKLLIRLFGFRFAHFCVFACFLIDLSWGDISRAISFFRWYLHLRFRFVAWYFTEITLWWLFIMWSCQYSRFYHLFWLLFRFDISSSTTRMMGGVFGANRDFLIIFVLYRINFTWSLSFQPSLFRFRIFSLILFIFTFIFALTLTFALTIFSFVWSSLLQKLIPLLNCLIHCIGFM